MRGDGGRGVRGDRGDGVQLLFPEKKFAECCRSSTQQKGFFIFFSSPSFLEKIFYVSLPSVVDLALGNDFFFFSFFFPKIIFYFFAEYFFYTRQTCSLSSVFFVYTQQTPYFAECFFFAECF